MNIIILGGGCYGLQYSGRLLSARAGNKISFEKLYIIDKDKNCPAGKEIKDASVKIKASDWVDFLADHAENSPADTDDLIVPSHAAPHLLGKTFLKLLRSKRHNTEMADIRAPIGTSFEKILEKGVIAASAASWLCPADCIESEICPHLNSRRTWDLENILKEWARKNGLDLFYVFSARHFTSQVSAIPSKKIVEAWKSLKEKLRSREEFVAGVATSSACHGIVSVFNVKEL